MRVLLLSLVLLGDPSPDPPTPVPQFQPGDYAVVQGCVVYRMSFLKDGSYRAVGDDGSEYLGIWRWDGQERVLAIRESRRGSDCVIGWRVHLDEKMRPDWGTMDRLGD